MGRGVEGKEEEEMGRAVMARAALGAGSQHACTVMRLWGLP